MKRFLLALAFCTSLLVLLSLFLFPPVEAKENPLLTLLNLPAPPPPNPAVEGRSRTRDPKFYNKNDPPKDNAPIDQLLDYWLQQNGTFQDLRYSPEPSEKVLDRIMQEIGKNPKLLSGYLNILPNGSKSADFVKDIFDRESTSGVFDRNERKALKGWLTYHSPYFSSDLARLASSVSDTGEYVTNQDELLALTRVDFDKASPLIDRLYHDSSLKTSRVLATWALYRHALETNSTGDIDQYRDQLKGYVEDKTAMPGMRDLAMDALVSEKEWSGRDDWYFSLLGDETLADLRVNGTSYTGLTTLMLVSPDDKYVDKLIELSQSDNRVVRGAAVRDLLTRLENGGPGVLKALLPWLDDPKWVDDPGDSRTTLLRKLSEYSIPESVPGLIKVIDERQKRVVPSFVANMPASMAFSMANSSNTAAYAVNVNAVKPVGDQGYSLANRPANTAGVEITGFPYRSAAVAALTKQKDMRAVPVLRRILPEGELYESGNVVKALLACGGFTVIEQLDALDLAARGVLDEIENVGANSNATGPSRGPGLRYFDSNSETEGIPRQKRPLSQQQIKALLSQQLQQADEITDDLARAIVERIETLDTKEPALAGAYRRMILKWQNSVINLLLLHDLKRGTADADSIVRLLSQRKELRENQSPDIFDIRTGKPMAVGISACLLEDPNEYAATLDGDDTEAKTAMLACARLIRAPLPVAKVIQNLKGPNEMLQIAAERYLESEDSAEARTAVLSRHPGEALILGATTAFYVAGAPGEGNEYLWMMYQSVGDNSLYNGWNGSGNDGDLREGEKKLQVEIKKDNDLLGIYAYDRNYIRIYKNKVIFSYDEDDSRYRERPLTKDEFDEIKSYLTTNRADELPPFLSCGGSYCMARELIMVGRNGGRRVYVNGNYDLAKGAGFEFFTGLEKYFAGLKQDKGTLKYGLSRDIPGLEIVLASDELHAETVWKDGNDLRIAASDRAVRKKVQSEIDDADVDETVEPTDESSEDDPRRAALMEKRRYEGFSWYKIVDGAPAGIADQPPMVDFIPVHDGLDIQPSDEQWKARAGALEIRTSDEGIFKNVRGRLTRVRKGNYKSAIVTPEGRWAIAFKYDDEGTENVVRIDLATNKEYLIDGAEGGQYMPVAYVPTLGKVLLKRNENYGSDSESGSASDDENDIVPGDPEASGMLLIDPATGETQEVTGEFRPLSQQTFRPLQKASKSNEYWAAIYDTEKNETVVGIYNMSTLGFSPVLHIPKIRFNSMSMWVDEPGGKVYFVYRGHLLALPLAK